MLVYGKCAYVVMYMLYIVYCVHHVAVFNAALCMAFSVLMLFQMPVVTIWKRNTPEPVS